MLSNDNVQIAVRVRPFANHALKKFGNNEKEEVRGGDKSRVSIVEIQSDHNGSKNILALTNRKVNNYLHAVDSREKIKYFNFDYCFDEYSTQKEIYSNFKETIIDSIKNEYHICIFAYGQSATGKTYTMVGTEENPGLIPRFGQDLFGLTKDNYGDKSRTFISFLEIYNEKVQDLFANNDDQKSLDGSSFDHTTIRKSMVLKVREHPETGPYVSGLIEREITDENDLLENFRNANRRRTVAETDQNRYSSRSHSIFIIKRIRERTGKSCYYYLIDLAGSEKIFCKNRLQEGACINKSLTSLSNVFTALASKKKYVPYRDSTLTWLLKNILDEKSKILMIATISSEQQCHSETLNTLRFGLKVKKIRPQPMKNRNDFYVLEQLKLENYQLREKIEQLLTGGNGGVTGKKLCCNQETQTLIDRPDLIEHCGNRKQTARFFCEQFSQQSIEIHVNEIVLKQLDYQIAANFLSEKRVPVIQKSDKQQQQQQQPVVYCLAAIETSDFRQVLSTFFDHAFELIGHLKLASDLLKPTAQNQLPVFI